MRISGKTKVYGLIGDPVTHSLSPSFQNAAFEHLGLNYIYVVFRVRKEHLSHAVQGIRSLNLSGVNITMPYKTDIIRFLDEIDKNAKSVGSVNTIRSQDGKLNCYTTDGIGALKSLRYNGTDPFNKRITILGAGGASRSVSLALTQEAKTLASGALADGLSWTGPAVAAVAPQEKVDRIMSHWEKFGGEIIETRVNTKKACVVQDTS